MRVCVCVCVCVCVGVYIRVGWNACPGHTTKVSSGEPAPTSIKVSHVTDLTDDDSPLRLPTSEGALFIHVGWSPCPGHTTKVSSEEPIPTSIMNSHIQKYSYYIVNSLFNISICFGALML